MWTKRGKACLILIFSANTNCENMAYRSFRSEKCSARGVRKVTTGITSLGIGKSILKLKEFRTRLTLPWPTLLLSFARLHPQSSFVFEWPKWQTRFAGPFSHNFNVFSSVFLLIPMMLQYLLACHWPFARPAAPMATARNVKNNMPFISWICS